LQESVKRTIDDNPEWTVRRSYNDVLAQGTVQQAAVTTPLSAVERTLQRHKVRTRPTLPTTRQDLLLGVQYASTSDGRPFVLVDDGQADRILVFGTAENLERYYYNMS
jgi:hypothetical protein